MKKLPATSVSFETDNSMLQRIYDSARQKLLENIRDYAGKRILDEGAGYNKVFLESQAMGGEMYAKYDMEVALNNQLIFMQHQREDGRLPGTVERGVKDMPMYNKTQGLFFAEPALNMYYWMGDHDHDYLLDLYNCLARFDEYLWRVRDSDGDGCLEAWCMTDTGEDHAVRYGNAPFRWEEERAPEGYDVVPIASMDVMSFSYSCRNVCAKISALLNNGKEAFWKQEAQKVADKLRDHLWDEERGACYDRDKQGRKMPILLHNNLRCMYWGSLSQEMADRFVQEHLCNPEEFWTPMPLPSVALNDPMFRNISSNNWSGQPEGLTYQRAIRALENYGYEKLIPQLGWKLFGSIGEEGRFAQQYDVYTGKPTCEEGITDQGGVGGLGNDCYSPIMCATLEYMSRMFGVHLEGEEIWWGITGGQETAYTLNWGEHTYTLTCDGQTAVAMHNGQVLFRQEAGWKVITDYEGRILKKVPLK